MARQRHVGSIATAVPESVDLALIRRTLERADEVFTSSPARADLETIVWLLRNDIELLLRMLQDTGAEDGLSCGLG